mmetsp:Transcript_34870/g.68863  ORF Transcript_34870/g.68863 Transcript_34870/m.68863 type:complete len:104 (+) Transcript_34870:544-855(+)
MPFSLTAAVAAAAGAAAAAAVAFVAASAPWTVGVPDEEKSSLGDKEALGMRPLQAVVVGKTQSPQEPVYVERRLAQSAQHSAASARKPLPAHTAHPWHRLPLH